MGTHHQPYFLEKAKEDLVHHSAAWVVKKPERSPIFVDCHAIEDPSLDRGWDLQVKVWQRNEIGLWASVEEIQQSGELGDAYDGAGFARALAGESGAFAQISYNVFEEVVDEHDTNYLIALAISIDALPARVTEDEASKRIRSNADQASTARSASRTLRPPRSMIWRRCMRGTVTTPSRLKMPRNVDGCLCGMRA